MSASFVKAPRAVRQEVSDKQVGATTRIVREDEQPTLRINVTLRQLVIIYRNGTQLIFNAENHPSLSGIPAQQLGELTLGLGGLSLRHDGLDVDISVPGLMADDPALRLLAGRTAEFSDR